ncbi:amidohydrolase [Aspergillus sclerotialis]|uniref:Amidohydrolase n=1 Tax=Aspergillus sclerotialis TaxID=2070753 RepID=A0A3A2ZYC2_9EURO|nr:amidohydrolase [Aspergillus sclerotialis]
MPIPIIDSHIHLFPESHLPTLAWYSPDSPLGSQHSIDEYCLATASTPTSPNPSQSTYLRGFIFLETDRISSISEQNWNHALDEVSFLTRIALGEPIPGEGHCHENRLLCLGIIPWAPVPAGPEALKRYMDLVKGRTKTADVWRKVRGVRYLAQDKPSGTLLQQEFINGLKWLGKQGLTFDLGVDARQGGLWQLREAVEMMERVYEGVENENEKITFIINHLCKPNLRLPFSPDSITTHPDFLEWKSLVSVMARFPKTYMKLSGAFSEFPPLSSVEPDIPSLVESLGPWTDVIFDTFGPERVLFGSDWPVCNMGGGGNEVSWRRWRTVVEKVLDRRRLTEDQRKAVWGQAAASAYGVEL